VTLSKKSKGSPYLIARDDPGSWQSACRWCESLGCPYFLPGLQLPSQPLRGLLPISLLGEQSWMDTTPLVYHNPSHSNQRHLFLFINSTRTKNATDEHDQQFSLMASSQCQWLPFNKLRMTKCKKNIKCPRTSAYLQSIWPYYVELVGLVRRPLTTRNHSIFGFG